jgi:SAM-dependent methyltransferase
MRPDPRERFTDRVEAYARHRPGYPRTVVEHIREATGLEPSWVVADVGSGTGLSSLPFLNQGNRVLAIEPNDAMRAAAEHFLASRPNFRSVAGSAEATGLESGSVDLVVVGQAFHWFERAAAKAEFRRILKVPGWVAIVWNRRRTTGDAFSERYEALLQSFGTDYDEVRHDRLAEEDIRGFLEHRVRSFSVPNEQSLDLEGLRGRLLSSSYTPAAEDPAREAMLHALDGVFSATHEGGYVRMLYDTEIWVGTLHAAG